MEPDDATLIGLIAAGDCAAMETFHVRWFPQFARLATRLTGDGGEGEEVAQEAVVRVITGAATYRPGAPAHRWLVTILRNLVRDRGRRQAVRHAVPLSGPDGGPDAVQVPDRAPTAHERVEARERAAAVHHALGALPVELREVIVLRDYQGLSPAQAAEALEMTVELVSSRLHRARKQLGAALQTGWPDLFPPGTL